MLHRIITGLAALAIGTLAIGLPIMLTEAGTSTSAGSGRTLNASFEYRDPATGDWYYGNVYASLSEYTNRTNDNGGGGGGGSGGSGRAKSGRPNGGNSQRPGGGGGGGTQTWTSNDVSVYVDRYSENGQWLAAGDGYSNSGVIIIAGDLSAGTVNANLALNVYRPDGSNDVTTANVALDFTATGSLITRRERYSEHIKSPRQSYSSMTTSSRRIATATGDLTVGGALTGGGSIDVAADGAYYAEIATFENRSRSSY